MLKRLERRYQSCWREGRDFVPLRACLAGLVHSSSVEAVGATVRYGRHGRECSPGILLWCLLHDLAIWKHAALQKVLSFVYPICLSAFQWSVACLTRQIHARARFSVSISKKNRPLKGYICFYMFWEATFYS